MTRQSILLIWRFIIHYLTTELYFSWFINEISYFVNELEMKNWNWLDEIDCLSDTKFGYKNDEHKGIYLHEFIIAHFVDKIKLSIYNEFNIIISYIIYHRLCKIIMLISNLQWKLFATRFETLFWNILTRYIFLTINMLREIL